MEAEQCGLEKYTTSRETRLDERGARFLSKVTTCCCEALCTLRYFDFWLGVLIKYFPVAAVDTSLDDSNSTVHLPKRANLSVFG